MRFLARARTVGTVAAAVVGLTALPASASTYKDSIYYSDAGFQLKMRVYEYNSGTFFAQAYPENDTAGNTTRTIYYILMQCDGFGGNCSQAAASSTTTATYSGWAAIYAGGDYAASFGHNYKACGSISGTQILSVCSPLMSYTTA
jgi:hypothetical protein